MALGIGGWRSRKSSSVARPRWRRRRNLGARGIIGIALRISSANLGGIIGAAARLGIALGGSLKRKRRIGIAASMALEMAVNKTAIYEMA